MCGSNPYLMNQAVVYPSEWKQSLITRKNIQEDSNHFQKKRRTPGEEEELTSFLEIWGKISQLQRGA